MPAGKLKLAGRFGIRGVQFAQLVFKQLRKPQQNRQADLALLDQVVDYLFQIGIACVTLSGPHQQGPARSDLEIAGAPRGDLVNVANFVPLQFVHEYYGPSPVIGKTTEMLSISKPTRTHSPKKAPRAQTLHRGAFEACQISRQPITNWPCVMDCNLVNQPVSICACLPMVNNHKRPTPSRRPQMRPASTFALQQQAV